MRSFENGSLKMEGHPVFGMPPHNLMRVPMVNAPAPHLLTKLDPERMYLLGDPRTNQNPAFLVLGIVFYRWHNYQVISPHPPPPPPEVLRRRGRISFLEISN